MGIEFPFIMSKINEKFSVKALRRKEFSIIFPALKKSVSLPYLDIGG